MIAEGDLPAPGIDAAARQVAAFRVLHAVSTSVHASLDLTETLDAVAQGVVDATCFAVAAVNLVLPTGDYQVVAVAGAAEIRAQLLGVVEPAATWARLDARSRVWGDLRFVHHDDVDATDDVINSWVPDVEPPDDPSAWHPLDTLFAPLTTAAGEWVGALSVDLPEAGRRPGPDQLEILTLFAGHAALAIEHARVHSTLRNSRNELAHAATHDPLTGLANRSLMMTQAPAMAATPGTQLGVLALDLDGFKAINDTAGHQAGDELLATLAKRMRGCLRDGDLIVRTGGDEFVIVVLGDGLFRLLTTLAARLQAAVAEPVRSGEALIQRVGVSIGTAIANTPTDFAALLQAADADMYRVKDHRRRAE